MWRRRGEGEDYRYREMRDRRPGNFSRRSLVTVFWLQALLLWAISAPLLPALRAAEPRRLGWLDLLAVVFFGVGITFEVGGDWQLARFKSDPANRGRVLDRGLWRYTRHPNYFGDAMVWWGLFLFAGAVGAWWTFYSPVLMTVLLVKVSGVALLERGLVDRKPGYRGYVERTSAFLPWFPKDEGRG
jgi:steroid 5-alpha reductase family enzyme